MPKFETVRRELRGETQLGTITENSQMLTCEELETSTFPKYNANVCEDLNAEYLDYETWRLNLGERFLEFFRFRA